MEDVGVWALAIAAAAAGMGLAAAAAALLRRARFIDRLEFDGGYNAVTPIDVHRLTETA